MPTTNAYYKTEQQLDELKKLTPKLKKYLANILSCEDISLTPDEISIRLIKAEGEGKIGSVELEITAFSFPERVQNEDKICLDVAEFLQKESKQLGEIKVWLILTELGHSWE